MSEEQQEKHGEFERSPVPESKTRGFKAFVGMYAGEHCAGTELMIGPLFVAAGVSAFDVVFGLILGNLLAVLSWMFLCAPIAVRARLTLYYQLEKICGRNLVTLYNLVNGIMFCFLAGSMITVSATALGVWFHFPMPGLNDIYPNSMGWVLAVLGVGAVISIVAAWGYDMVSRIANIAAPWMVLVFLGFGIIGLRQFMDASGSEVSSAAGLWDLCKTTIWKGGEALPGQVKFTFWHVMFFAWFCNMAMHVGMSDLSVFRFAKKSWHGVASGAGMYVGHFMAWLAAAVLFALQLYTTHPSEYTADLLAQHSAKYSQIEAAEIMKLPMDAELIREGMQIEAMLVENGQMKAEDKQIAPPAPLPGPLAANAAGIAGLICVIIAGWTTANPTIYRAGLAFQAIVPKISRFKVTIATGMLATVAGMFPGIAMRLLGFVMLYGMLLMPMGAVIFTDFWVFPKLGLKQYYAEHKSLKINWAAGTAWVITMIVCYSLYKLGIMEIYFVSLPGWFLASALYIVVSKLQQKGETA